MVLVRARRTSFMASVSVIASLLVIAVPPGHADVGDPGLPDPLASTGAPWSGTVQTVSRSDDGTTRENDPGPISSKHRFTGEAFLDTWNESCSSSVNTRTTAMGAGTSYGTEAWDIPVYWQVRGAESCSGTYTYYETAEDYIYEENRKSCSFSVSADLAVDAFGSEPAKLNFDHGDAQSWWQYSAYHESGEVWTVNATDPCGMAWFDPRVGNVSQAAFLDVSGTTPSADTLKTGDVLNGTRSWVADGRPEVNGSETWELTYIGERCDGVDMEEVNGIQPAYLDATELTDFPNADTMCSALWVPQAGVGFVPQGLALTSSGSAWVSGYTRSNTFISKGNPNGERCQLELINLETGARERILRGISNKTQTKWCQHGGGAALTPHGLWVVDTKSLWLLDPAKAGISYAVKRRWTLSQDGAKTLRGSFLLEGNPGMLGIGQFEGSKADRIRMFRYQDIMRSGVTQLIGSGSPTASQAAPATTAEAVQKAQGATFGTSNIPGLFASSSTATCGMLARNGGIARFGFGPGAEEIQFTADGHLWAVFEASAEHFYNRDHNAVPMLARFDASQLLADDAEPENCAW